MIKKTKWKQMIQQIQGNWEGEKGVTKGIKVNFHLPTGDHWLKWFALCLLICVEIKSQIELCASLHLLYVIVNVLSSLLFVICLSFDFKCLVKPCQEV